MDIYMGYLSNTGPVYQETQGPSQDVSKGAHHISMSFTPPVVGLGL